MLLYGQLQEGLLYTLMESPSVSGAQNYRELCLAAKREEQRLAGLKKEQEYLKTQPQTSGVSQLLQARISRREITGQETSSVNLRIGQTKREQDNRSC